jgi:hydroxyacylglutathione hydrolase
MARGETILEVETARIHQVRLAKMATCCYIVADIGGGVCAIIDPAFETARILQIAARAGYHVTHVINTHAHSDHTAGNAAVLGATGARLLIHRDDAPTLQRFTNRILSRLLGGQGSPPPDRLLNHGDEIRIGSIRIAVIHTPGHTVGSISLFCNGSVFTGDTLFVGGIGRTDLPGGSLADLLQSIRERIYTLPEETVVWPGHDYGAIPRSTVAAEMRTNPFTRI